MICPDCGHQLDAHGPDGCVVILDEFDVLCECDRPGNQGDLFGDAA